MTHVDFKLRSLSESCMTISISNFSIDNTAPLGTVIGVLTAQDASGTASTMQFHINEKFRRITCYLRTA